MNDIFTIAANLATQDNRITANPIFFVEQKRRVYGLEESDTYIWIGPSGEEVDDQMAIALDAAEQDGQDTVLDPEDVEQQLDIDDYRKSYYRDEYVFVQPFFTEAGAKRYIEINGHNLREPRIYVEGGYRNEEWETIREYLMGLKPKSVGFTPGQEVMINDAGIPDQPWTAYTGKAVLLRYDDSEVWTAENGEPVWEVRLQDGGQTYFPVSSIHSL